MRSLISKLAQIYPKSLIAEFNSIFGIEDAEKLISVFGGTTLKVPSNAELLKLKRDLEIYEALSKAVSRDEFRTARRTIQAKLGLSKGRIRSIFRYMKRLHKDEKGVEEVDEAVSKHKRKKMKIRSKKRKW